MTFFVPEKRTVDRYKREDIRVDDNHLKSTLRWLTERDISILRLLYKYPFLTTTQIQFFIFNSLKFSSQQNKATERLRRLYKAHLIDRWFPPTELGSAESHYVLDVGGAKILALKGDKNAETFRRRNYVPQTYSHSLKIFDFRAMLSVLQKQEDFQLKAWRMEKKNTMEFPLNDGKKGSVEPDAMCIYMRSNRLKAFFLECDNGTMSDNQLKSKIQRYVQLYKSEEWKKTDWAKALKAFPPVVILMQTEEDIRKLNAYTSRVESNIRFYYARYDDLIEVDSVIYENARGKRREVAQDIRIKLLEDIFISKENGRVSI